MGKAVAICLILMLLIVLGTFSEATTRYIKDGDTPDDNSAAYTNPTDPRIQSTDSQYIQPTDPLGLQFLYYIKSINGIRNYAQDILLRSGTSFLTISENENTITFDVNVFTSATLVLFLHDEESPDISDYNRMEQDLEDIPEVSLYATITSDGQSIRKFVTDINSPALDFIDSGIVNFHAHALNSKLGSKDLTLSFNLYKRDFSGNETLLLSSAKSIVLPMTETLFDLDTSTSLIDLNLTDRLVLELIGNVSGTGTDPDLEFKLEGTTATRVEIPVASLISGDFVKISDLNNVAGIDLAALEQCADGLIIKSNSGTWECAIDDSGISSSCDNNADCTITGDITGATGWHNSCDNNADCTLSGTVTGNISGAAYWQPDTTCDNNATCEAWADGRYSTGSHTVSCDQNADCDITGTITNATGWHNSCDNNATCTISGSISTATDASNTWQDDIGADCGAGDFVKGVDDDGTLDCDTPAGGDVNRTDIYPDHIDANTLDLDSSGDPIIKTTQRGNTDMFQGFSMYGGTPTKSIWVDENGTLTIDMSWNDISITPNYTYEGINIITGSFSSYHDSEEIGMVVGSNTELNPYSSKYVLLVRGGAAATLWVASTVGSLSQPTAAINQGSATGNKPAFATYQSDTGEHSAAFPYAPIQVGYSTAGNQEGITLYDTADSSVHCVTILNNALSVGAGACAAVHG